MCLSGSVSFSVYRKIFLKICCDIFRKMFQKCEHFSYELLFAICWPPIPIPGVNVKVPFPGWSILWTNVFIDFYEKLKNGTKTITSCSIRRVGRRWSIPRTGMFYVEDCPRFSRRRYYKNITIRMTDPMLKHMIHVENEQGLFKMYPDHV